MGGVWVVAKAETIEAFIWPKKCPGCGQDFIENGVRHVDQQVVEQIHSKMDSQLVQEIRSNMELKDSSELFKIWKENDRQLYSDEAFKVVRELLMERDEDFVRGGLPPQKEPLPKISGYEKVKIEKSLGARFVRTRPKALSVRLCTKCSKRVSRFKVIGYVGLVLVMLAIIGGFRGLRTPQQMQGAGASFWLGSLLYWVGENRRKKAIGFRCKRLSKDKYELWFRRDPFRKEFFKLNSALLEWPFSQTRSTDHLKPILIISSDGPQILPEFYTVIDSVEVTKDDRIHTETASEMLKAKARAAGADALIQVQYKRYETSIRGKGTAIAFKKPEEALKKLKEIGAVFD
jgi:hypothetical protein